MKEHEGHPMDTTEDNFALDGKGAPALKKARKKNKTIHGVCIYCDIEIADHPKDFNSLGVVIINKDKDSERYMHSYGSAHIICDTRINNDKRFYNWVLNKDITSYNKELA